MVDWNIFAAIASPIIALFIGVWLNRLIEKRAQVIAYLGHVSGISLRGEHPVRVNTHSVVLRNVGRKTANNVRLGHITLPDFSIFPDLEYGINELPGGGKEIVIPKLIPQKQITISYLYIPPLTWDRVNTHLESDEGPIKVVNVLPTIQIPKWLTIIVWILIVYGIIGVLYTVWVIFR